MTPVALGARVGVRLGDFRLDIDVEVGDGETIALVGPNGSGKTTFLRAVAGLVPIEDGAVVLDGRTLEDPATGVRAPPEDRPIGVVFQDHALFPHLTALENVAFGLRARGTSKGQARAEALDWLGRVGVADAATSRPGALSGGQAQRVALARALATRPRLLLLDEPLASVDQASRPNLRRLLRGLGDATGGRVLVTHDPLEAAALADRVVVVESGRVIQAGSVTDVTARPRSPWVAAMVGLNLLRGQVDGGTFVLPSGATLNVVNAGVLGDAFAVFHPRAVTLHRLHPEGSARNAVSGRAGDLWREGERARIAVTGPFPLIAEVTRAAVADLRLDEGGPVWATFKATDVDVYPA